MAILDPGSVKKAAAEKDETMLALFIAGKMALEGSKDYILQRFQREITMHSGLVEVRGKDENNEWTKIVLRRQGQ